MRDEMRDQEVDQAACHIIADTVAAMVRNERLNEQDLIARARMLARAIRTGLMEYYAPGREELEESGDEPVSLQKTLSAALALNRRVLKES